MSHYIVHITYFLSELFLILKSIENIIEINYLFI